MSEAATVAEAMTALADPFDWVLLDLMLPDGCGLDVLRRLRAAAAATKVCIVTGCGTELLDQARRAGAEHTFTKPLDVSELMTVLQA